MHIVDGALSAPVLAMSGIAAITGCAIGLKKIDLDHVPQVGLLSATFFLASLIHVPIGPSSVHLILNGLVGLILGWTAFPALLVGLLLQTVFFGFGGVVVLGVNVVNIALSAVVVHYLFRRRLARRAGNGTVFIWGFLAGGLAIVLTTALVALALAFSGEEFLPAAKLVFYAHIPIMILEGFLTGAAVVLIARVRPEMFRLPDRLHADQPDDSAFVTETAGTVGIVALAALALPSVGQPHNIIADAYVEGGIIEGEVGFSNGDSAINAPVTVTDATGAILGTTHTDDDGVFYFQVERIVDHHFEVDAGAGHVTHLLVKAEDLSLGGDSGAPAAKKPDPAAIPVSSSSPSSCVSTAHAPDADAAALRQMVEKAVAKQIKPLRKQILQYENKIRLHDVLGGLGYILGLTGLAVWLGARRGRPGK